MSTPKAPTSDPLRPDGYTEGLPGSPQRRDDVLARVLQEYDLLGLLQQQNEKRQAALKKFQEMEEGRLGGRVGVLAFFCSESLGASIDSDDVPPITDALLSIGDVDTLDLIIAGPGGDGTTAEKIVSLCRAYCGKLRVVIPNRAKSAATIVALGADTIVMGFCSELGPIDAQVPVVVGGIPRYISAQSFIDAREELEARFKEAVAKKEDPRAVLQQLATMDQSYIDHCRKLMGFSRDVAEKFLREYMFKADTNERSRGAKIKKVLKALSTVDDFKVHGRLINAHRARHDLKLDVELLPKDDDVWKQLWQYYVRADTSLSQTGHAKLVETPGTSFIKGKTTW